MCPYLSHSPLSAPLYPSLVLCCKSLSLSLQNPRSINPSCKQNTALHLTDFALDFWIWPFTRPSDYLRKMVAAGRWLECRGDLLAEGAKSLQLRLRDRFRVAAVDYHRRRNSRSTNTGYLSSSVQSWLDRFSEFRRDSLPSSSTFYRKKGFVMWQLLFYIWPHINIYIHIETAYRFDVEVVPVLGNARTRHSWFAEIRSVNSIFVTMLYS